MGLGTAGMTKLVIIDVDQTLITGESFKRFVVAEIIGKRPLCAFGVSKSYLLRRLGIISIESFKESCLASLKGRSRAELEAMGDNFSETWLSTKIRDGGKTVVDSIRQQGNCGILFSGSIDIYI